MTPAFEIGDLIRDIEGDTYRVIRVWSHGGLMDIETTEGTRKTITGVPSHFFKLKPA